MKILLLGEYSNVHWTLAEGLRALGHEVTVVSNGDFWKNYPRDIDVARKGGRLGGIRLYAKLLALLPRLRNYDIVQLINPVFFELKAERLPFFYRYLRRHNKKIILGAFGMDYYWVNECITRKPLRYSDFNIGDQLRTTRDAIKEQREWLGSEKGRLNQAIAEDCDAIVTGLYEYWACYQPSFPDKTTFIPYPIRMPAIASHQSDSPETAKPSVVHAFIGINRSRNEYKGTDVMLKALEAVQDKYPDKIKISKAVSVPFADYQRMMNDSDVILDQLYSYTPSMNSLLAMSKGIICMGGGEPENYAILHESDLRPIINVGPTYESVFMALEDLVKHIEQLPQLKADSIAYVRKHHDFEKVARQYEKLYQSLLDN
jgi:glycosyltransferase involved in cell wall biosynthesis